MVPTDVDEAFARGDNPGWERFADPWTFYLPEHIAQRQIRWREEDSDDWEVEDTTGEFDGDDELFASEYATSIFGGETIVRSEPKVGRNDPCPCGSGKKYKKCCLH